MYEVNFLTTHSLSQYLYEAEQHVRQHYLPTLDRLVRNHISGVTPRDLNTNQYMFEDGKHRWASALLDEVCRYFTQCRIDGKGMSRVGLNGKDLRVMKAVVLLRVLPALPVSSVTEYRLAYNQLYDYLKWKEGSREYLNRMLGKETQVGGFISQNSEYHNRKDNAAALLRQGQITSEEYVVMTAAYQAPQATPKVDPNPQPTSAIAPAIVGVKPSPYIVPDLLTCEDRQGFDIYQSYADSKGITREEAKQAIYMSLYSNYPIQHKPTKGDSTMSLGVPIAPQPPVAPAGLDYNKPVIEDIKHVYGVPVKNLSVAQITDILTSRQNKVDQLKAIPHKPEVVKAQIASLKAEIKDLLALANELFPVAE